MFDVTNSSTANATSTNMCNHASIAWLSLSTLLVLGMLPALALFEAGMLRTKSTFSIVTQIFAGLSILSTMWFVFGYSLTFGRSQGHFIGDLQHALLLDVSASQCHDPWPIPELLFAMFQSMFATIAPLLVTGAFAERLRFSVVVAFLVLWEVLIYYPTAQAIWNVDGWLKRLKVLDFAGGLVLHTPAGVSALVCAKYLGPRCDFDKYKGQYLPSNLPVATIGCALLWAGWFGVSACLSGFSWLMLSWVHGKPAVAMLLNGVIAGLAGITPGSGYVSVPAAFVIGVVVGVASFYAAIGVRKLRIDDALSVFAVHGVTGMLGSIAIGVAADEHQNEGVWRGGGDVHPGSVVNGSGVLLGRQVLATLFVSVYALVMTYIIMRVLDLVFKGKLRVSKEEEEIGLDWTDHDGLAYHNLMVTKSQPLRRRHQANVAQHGAGAALSPSMRSVESDGGGVTPISLSEAGLAGGASRSSRRSSTGRGRPLLAGTGAGFRPPVEALRAEPEDDSNSDGPPEWDLGAS